MVWFRNKKNFLITHSYLVACNAIFYAMSITKIESTYQYKSMYLKFFLRNKPLITSIPGKGPLLNRVDPDEWQRPQNMASQSLTV